MDVDFLDHPADIGFRARGTTLEELFANSAAALVSIILDPLDINLAESIELGADGIDHESLLVNFLNEVLYYVDGKNIALGRFEIPRVHPTHIECIATGEPRKPQKHLPRLVVKAVTYHQLRVSHTEAGWVAEVYVDV